MLVSPVSSHTSFIYFLSHITITILQVFCLVFQLTTNSVSSHTPSASQSYPVSHTQTDSHSPRVFLLSQHCFPLTCLHTLTPGPTHPIFLFPQPSYTPESPLSLPAGLPRPTSPSTETRGRRTDRQAGRKAGHPTSEGKLEWKKTPG